MVYRKNCEYSVPGSYPENQTKMQRRTSICAVIHLLTGFLPPSGHTRFRYTGTGTQGLSYHILIVRR